MTCVICRQARPDHGDTGARWRHRCHPGVPARVCDNCGEEYLDETMTAELLKTADAAAQAGVQGGRPRLRRGVGRQPGRRSTHRLEPVRSLFLALAPPPAEGRVVDYSGHDIHVVTVYRTSKLINSWRVPSRSSTTV
jgi:hypothetical protein